MRFYLSDAKNDKILTLAFSVHV